MSSSKRRLVPAILAGAVVSTGALGGAARGQAVDPSIQELKAQNQALMARIERLEGGQKQQQDRQAVLERDVVDATVKSVMSDAGRRSQYFADVTDLTAGHNKKNFFIRSDDGNFTFSPTFHMQMRYVANFRSEEADDDGDDDSAAENGFELRRMKFGAEGKAFGDFTYKFVWFTNRSGGGVALEDAIVKYQVQKGLSIVAGQFKDPVHHEELVSSSKQMSADRSLVNELIGGGYTDRVQGVGIEYQTGALELLGFFHDGIDSDNTNFRDSPANDSDWGIAARVEYTVFGDKKNYGDFTARYNKTDMLVVGAAGDISGLADGNSYTYTIDAQYETGAGLGLYAAILGTSVESHTGDGDGEGAESGDNFGFLVQAGYMLNDDWEVFGRYGFVDLEDGDQGSIHEIVGGVNYYIHDHNVKVTGDLTYLPNGSPADTGLGILDSGDEDQLVARVQFQLLL